MSTFYAARNLTEQTVAPCVPWDFTITEEIPAQVRGNKEDRQRWYRTATTVHNFYTGCEAANPNIRASKDNPVRLIHGFVADYDLQIPDARIDEAIAAMEIKPSWVERSLGGNARLVWILPRPLLVEDSAFAITILTEAEKWLDTAMLPGLDGPAFRDPNRLFCNGGIWRATGHDAIPENALQAFFVTSGRKHRFAGEDSGAVIPLDVVEKELTEKYPGFAWPSEFVLESQGPSFWIAGSASPLSAVLKPEGFFTFSAHADKPFYSWADILGADFVKQFAQQTITKATSDIYWDGKRFWRKKVGYYVSLDMTELLNYFKVNCRLSTKPGKDGQSPVDHALNHIYTEGHVIGAAPFLARPSGLLDFNGKRVLNTYVNRAMKPAEFDGPSPFLDAHFDVLFDPYHQLDHFRAWWKHFYTAMLTLTPMPGQNIYLMGDTNVGKTMTLQLIVAMSVGGFCDASSFLVRGDPFNSDLFEAPLWCVDDETPGGSPTAQANFLAMLKKVTANQHFRHNKKFEISTLVEWMGRVGVAINLDFVSSRMLGPMDDGSRDKTNLFRCSKKPAVFFPSRHELVKIVTTELPFYLRRLLAWNPPDHVIRDTRYGYAAYHEPTLLDQSHQSSRTAPFKEILIEALSDYFAASPSEQVWRGTASQLIRLIHSNVLNEHVTRSMRLEQITRYLEQIQRENMLPCTVEKGQMNTRVWVFARFGELANPAPQPEIAQPAIVNIFTK